MNNNQVKGILFKLCSSHGVSGCEDNICKCVFDIISPLASDISISEGTVTARIFSDSNLPKITLDAHIDQIGFIVTGFEKGGFLRVAPCGGIDARLLPGLPVKIHGEDEIRGFFCSTPPHLVSGDEKVVAVDESFIDTGLSDDKLKSIIKQGNSVSFHAPPKELFDTKVTSGSLDNRAGAAVLICALKMLGDRKPAYDITAIFTAQEELGCRGAITSAYSSNPEYAIAVDVSFALAAGESEHSCGIMGKGPMIGFSPVLDRQLSNKLCEIAKKSEIPYQREIMGGSTSTNADKYSVSRGGVKTSLVSIPIRYMHSPVEVADIEDIKASAKLLCEFLLDNDF